MTSLVSRPPLRLPRPLQLFPLQSPLLWRCLTRALRAPPTPTPSMSSIVSSSKHSVTPPTFGNDTTALDATATIKHPSFPKQPLGCFRTFLAYWSSSLCCLGVMVASYLSSSYLISASILSNLGAHLISHLIYGCGLVSS